MSGVVPHKPDLGVHTSQQATAHTLPTSRDTMQVWMLLLLLCEIKRGTYRLGWDPCMSSQPAMRGYINNLSLGLSLPSRCYHGFSWSWSPHQASSVSWCKAGPCAWSVGIIEMSPINTSVSTIRGFSWCIDLLGMWTLNTGVTKIVFLERKHDNNAHYYSGAKANSMITIHGKII